MVLIIGIIVSFAVLSIADRAQDDRLENEARRLTQLMRLASDEAVLLGIELGLQSDGENYQFLVLGEQAAWEIYETPGPLRPRKLSGGVTMELTAEDFTAPPTPEGEESLLPHMLFLSSGEVTPFRILLSAEGATRPFEIQGDLTGKINMQPVEDERR